jgi:murein DD-endopeptidase MepM/ murein hydrolase activator NlpD/beta-lactamase regulating signal transducer with metallopeptidase domain
MNLLVWLIMSSLAWGGVLWLAGRLLQRSPDVSGRARQWIWRGATALLLAPWIVAPVVIGFGLGLAPAETLAVDTITPAIPTEVFQTIYPRETADAKAGVIEHGGAIWADVAALDLARIALLILVGGWLVRFVLAQMALRDLLGIVMLSRKASSGIAHEVLCRWSQRLKLAQAPDLRLVQPQHSPFSYGALRPTVCLPDGLQDRLSRESLDLVVGHECVHVARRDGWLRPIERVAADFLWFNPFSWLIRRELDVARELAVDEVVVVMAQSRLAYARTLREVAVLAAGLPAGAPVATMALGGSRNLILRVSRTLSHAKRRPARAAILTACMLGVVCAPLAVAQVMLAVPAPAAPEAPPAPDTPVAIAALEAPEHAHAPEAPEAPEAPDPSPAPDAPPAPDEPPAAELDTQDGSVRATFDAKVVTAAGDSATGYRLELLQVGPDAASETCLAEMKGLGALSVARGQMVRRGDIVGHSRKGGQMMFAVGCSDQLDGRGYPQSGSPPPPPAPVSPVSLTQAVAPLAPTPRADEVSPAAPIPPAPPAWKSRQSPQPPAAPAAPRGVFEPVRLDDASGAVIDGPVRVSGPYGLRLDPTSQQRAFHSGVDIAAPLGTVVHSPVAGRVIHAGVLGASGKTVKVAAGEGLTLTFSQLDSLNVQVGDALAAGATVGAVGSSGRSTGPHLHLEVARNGQHLDPETVEGLTLFARR